MRKLFNRKFYENFPIFESAGSTLTFKLELAIDSPVTEPNPTAHIDSLAINFRKGYYALHNNHFDLFEIENL